MWMTRSRDNSDISAVARGTPRFRELSTASAGRASKGRTSCCLLGQNQPTIGCNAQTILGPVVHEYRFTSATQQVGQIITNGLAGFSKCRLVGHTVVALVGLAVNHRLAQFGTVAISDRERKPYSDRLYLLTM